MEAVELRRRSDLAVLDLLLRRKFSVSVAVDVVRRGLVGGDEGPVWLRRRRGEGGGGEPQTSVGEE